MKFKIFLVILLVSVFCFIPVAFAQTMTNAQRQALILQIQQLLLQLETQLAQILAQQQGAGSWCYTFASNLGYASSGTNELFNLHVALLRQGIPYNPDNVNTYSTGTYQAVAQFQSKYGINPIGFVGPITRAKLNQLYGCTTTAITCTPNWQCSAWGLCFSGQQSKTCTDSNSCGVTTNKPVEVQSCVQKPAVKIQANNSDGPVNIFLTLGNGAYINNSGITLTQNINLQWTGVDVSSCMASDSLTPKVFSGYKPSSSYQTVTLSGNIQGASSSNNKISDTFKIACVSTTTGSQVSDTVTVNLFYTVSGNCSPSWGCSSWTTCSSSRQTRTCADYNGCGSLVGKPSESQSCVVPPTVNIKANNSEGPITVSNGATVHLSWTSSRADSCMSSSTSGQWSGTKSASGTEASTITVSPDIFTITCANGGGTAVDSVTVNITGGT